MATTPLTDPTSIQARLEELRAKRGTFTTPTGAPLPTVTPAPKTAQFRKGGVVAQAKELTLTDDAKQIDHLVDELPMTEAVRMWGKPQNDYKRTGEHSVLIRCPNPSHPDNNPSANCDLERGLFHCFSCDTSGDKYTLAALHHGYGADYQAGRNFVELKKKVATDLGYTITETGGRTILTAPGQTTPAPTPVSFDDPNPTTGGLVHTDDGWVNPTTGELVEPNPAPVTPAPQPVQLQPAQPTPAPAPAAPAPSGPVPVSFEDIDLDDEPVAHVQPQLDWKPAGKNRSFIDRYMDCTQRDRYPDALGFSAALTCLSFIGGREVTMDMQDRIMGNFGMVMVAATGTGKSRAFAHAKQVLREVMPWKGAELAIATGGHVVPGHGVKFMPGAGSGENIIKQFEDTVKMQKGTDHKGEPIYEEEHMPVNGLISFDEFSQFVGKSSATGSTLRERVMNFLDGAYEIENTTNTQGSYKAVQPFACLNTSVQPSVIHRLMSENDEASGFLNRFMFFTGAKKPRLPYKVPPVDMSDAVTALKELKDFWDSQGTVNLDDSRIWQKKHDYLSTVSDPLENKQGIYGRLDALLHKLIILLCINECETVITEDILDKAIYLHKYFIATFEYVSNEMYDPSTATDTSASRNEDKVIERLKKVVSKKLAAGAQAPAEYGATARDIHQGTRRVLNLEQLTRILRSLVDAGVLQSVQTPRSVAYILNEN